jgi:glutaredoxin 1
MQPLLIYGHNQCGWCRKATSLCDSQGIPYVYVDVRKDLTAREQFLGMGHKTVPQVYQGSRLIGGYEHLAQEFSDVPTDD